MPAPASNRLADVVTTGNIVVTVPWAVIANDDEGTASTGTATYTIAVVPGLDTIYALCDDLDRLTANGTAVVT